MSHDLELNQPLLVSESSDLDATSEADESPESKRPKNDSSFISDKIGNDNGGLICVMFCMLIVMILLMIVAFYGIMMSYGLSQFVTSLFQSLAQTNLDFPVTRTQNFQHYQGILWAGGPPTDYQCHYQGDMMVGVCENENHDQALIQFEETGPTYYFNPAGSSSSSSSSSNHPFPVDTAAEESDFDGPFQFWMDPRRRMPGRPAPRLRKTSPRGFYEKKVPVE